MDFPYGGMISFRIRGGAREAERFLTATRLFTLAESLDGVESLAELPAQMMHGVVALGASLVSLLHPNTLSN